MLEIIFISAFYNKVFAAALTAPGRNRNGFFARQVLTGYRPGICAYILHTARGHHLAAVDARAGADVHDIVRRPDGILVMLHHDKGVADVPQVAQGIEQLFVVTLMQANAGLVENIQHPHQAGAYLGGQSYALALSAGQGPRRPGKSQISKTHADKEAKSCLYFFGYLGGYHRVPGRKGELFHKVQLVFNRQVSELRDVKPAHCHRQHFFFQSPAAALRAGRFGHTALYVLLHGGALAFVVAAVQVVGDALKGLVQHAGAPAAIKSKLQRLSVGAVHDNVYGGFGQLSHRGGQLEAVFFRQRVKIHFGNAVASYIVPAGSGDSPFQNALFGVRHNKLRVDKELGAQT